MTLGFGEDTREFLLKETEKLPRKRPKCPTITIEIEGRRITALIDTGSEVNAISEQLYQEMCEPLKKCPTLPLTGVTVTGATKGKPVKVTKQVFAKINLKRVIEAATIIIVPKLTSDCIIGIDFLEKIRSKIDLEAQELIFKAPDGPEKTYSIKFDQEEEEQGKNDKQRTIKMIEETTSAISNQEIDDKLKQTDWENSEQEKEFKKLIQRHRVVFRKTPGLLKTYRHELLTIPHIPFKAPNYAIPLAYREEVDKEIEKMLDQGIIQASKSPYNNPMVVVAKKDGSVRLCLDARKVNAILQPDHEKMETIESLFQECTSTRYMSSLDLRSSFWQVPLTKESRKYTAFTHRGHSYEFRVTPFGLKTSTASLVRGLRPVLQGLTHTINFVDDLLCMSETFEDHIKHLKEIFDRLEENGLTISLEKSAFFRKKIKFLGHVLTSEGIHPDPEKIAAIHNFPAPKNIKQLRGFLGLINYYTKFTKEHSEATIPLLELTRKNQPWRWNETEVKAFQNVKSKFIDSVVLSYPDHKKPFFLQTDASDYALGAVLFQKNLEGEHQVLQFASRTLKGAEVGYGTTEKELLAIIWALQKFRSYLLGAEIHVITDHAALTFLRECKLSHARITRWSLAIQDYHLQIEHCAGKKNTVADLLSRQGEIKQDKNVVIAKLAQALSPEVEELLRQLHILQNEDKFIENIKNECKNGNVPAGYHLKQEILYKITNKQYQALIPIEKAPRFIQECHEIYGHAGARKCYLILKEDFTCPHLYKLTRKTLQKCETCQKTKIYTPGVFAEMTNILPQEPNELLSLDYYGPLPTAKQGKKYLLVMIDVFSKLTILYALRKATTSTTLKCLLEDYIPRYGKPQSILSDQGTQFTSKIWGETLQSNGIRKIMTAIRHPRANPVERTNRELSRFFRTFVKQQHHQWIDWIKTIESCINETHHETTGQIPWELHSANKPERPWKNLLNKPQEQTHTHETLIMMARNNMRSKRKKQSSKFNNQHRITEFQLGDKVLVKALNVSNPATKTIAKFLPLYEGPYEIKRKISNTSYILKYIGKEKERGLFHAQDLRPYYQ